MTRKLYLLLLVGLILAIGANAQNNPFRVKNLETRPIADASVNYFELILKVFPALGFNETTANPTVNRSVDLRRLAGGVDEYTLYESPFEIPKVDGWWFEANGAKHLALLLEISKNPLKSGDDAALHYALAVFRYVSRTEKSGESQTRVTGEFRLVEAVDPQTDRFVEFPQDFSLIAESPKNQTSWIVNYHRYGGQTYSEDHTIRLGPDNRLSYGTGDFLPNRDEY